MARALLRGRALRDHHVVMSGQRGGFARNGAWAQYGIGAALALGALVTSRALAELTERPLYAILVAALALSTWLGGLRSGLVTLVVGWSLSPVLLETDPAITSSEGVWRWAASFVVSVGILWVAALMRQGRERATTAARVAESSTKQMEGMQELTAALLVAAAPSDVARELLRRTPVLAGARGGALGLIEGDELVIVDPGEVEFQTHRSGLRLPLTTKAPIARAAAEGEVQRVHSRADFEARFPDGAALAPYAQAAIAVPLCVADEIRGSLSLLFDRPDALHDESASIALIAADLGGQALERAELYQRELQSRQALDRILRVAPRFHAGTATEVAAAICREARVAFGSDLAVLWRLRGQRLELLQSDPESGLAPPGSTCPSRSSRGCSTPSATSRASFVPDVLDEAHGSGLGFVRDLGIRSSLRIPVTISGSIELVLSVSWQQVVSEPDASTVVLARRFADQAGLALEQLERREAEHEAVRRARETRRLLAATAALASATTSEEVTAAILGEGLQSLGAVAGAVACRAEEPGMLETVDTRGYREATVEPWSRFAIDAPVPLAEAVRENSIIAIESVEELADRYPALAENRTETTGSWLVLPLATADLVIGAVGLSFAEARAFSDADLAFAQSLARQSGQALDRALLLASEYTARTRAEDMVLLTSAFSRAVSPEDVVEALSAQLLLPGRPGRRGRLPASRRVGSSTSYIRPGNRSGLRRPPFDGSASTSRRCPPRQQGSASRCGSTRRARSPSTATSRAGRPRGSRASAPCHSSSAAACSACSSSARAPSRSVPRRGSSCEEQRASPPSRSSAHGSWSASRPRGSRRSARRRSRGGSSRRPSRSQRPRRPRRSR